MKTSLARIVSLAVSNLVALLVFLLFPSVASAQLRTWTGGDGNWSNAANWSDADVPNTVTESASITNGSAVSLNGNFFVGDLTLGALDSLEFLDSFDLDLNGDVTNDGTITMNGMGTETELRTNVDTTFSGSGELVIGANGATTTVNTIGANSAGANSTITNAAGHTIRALGPGSLGRANSAVVNQGSIFADGASANLRIDAETATGGLTNTGIIRAINGGQLDLRTLVSNSGAVIESNTGGLINLGPGAQIVAGQLVGEVAVNLNSVTTKISNLANTANINLGNGGDLDVEGTIVNNGSINLNGTGLTTELRTNANVTFIGGGEIVIGANGVNNTVNTIGANFSSNATITNWAGHTIRALGFGSLGRANSSILNEGLIVAEGASANLRINPRPAGGGISDTAVNTGTIRASGGGRVEVDPNLDNSNGTIEALGAGSTVELVSGFFPAAGTFIGTLRAIDGGSIVLGDSVSFDQDIGFNGGTLDFRGDSYTDIFDDTSLAVSPLYRIATASGPGSLQSNIFQENSGTFRIGDGLNFTTNIATTSVVTEFTNSGTIVAEAGSVFSAGGFTAGVITGEGGGGDIYILNGYVPFISTGTLAGSGEIRSTYQITASASVPDEGTVPRTDDLHSDGFIKPGDNPGETGTLTLSSIHEIFLGDSNVIEIELGDGEHDALDLITDTDPVALNGELAISLLPDFSFTPGEVLSIITATNGLTGTFDTETLPTLGGGFALMLNYEPNAVTLEVFLPGDFDVDGDVDGADFLEWQRNPAVGSLTAWQNSYGTGAGAAQAVTAVPEPTSLALASLCTGMFLRRQQHS